MDIIIITGASKGIGQQLLSQFKETGATVYGMARTNPDQLHTMYEVDLADCERATAILGGIVSQHMDEASSFTLINNAGMVDPISLVGSLDAQKVEQAIKLNLTAPIHLMNTFIDTLKDFKGTKKIMNISSGAGRSAYEGWGIYCTTKAGLDQFSRVVAEEQKMADYPTGIVSIAPGIIDTGMQETIRSSSEHQFPHLKRFEAYKREGQLSSAFETAEKLMRFVNEVDFLTIDPIADIRKFD
ncbi:MULTISPECIES: SDR family NAD(P)-dependent oxidoreductase [unclassified Sporosarcina]|uniref:SDR family NAD(P)-dependent oxidoreductase n=1 Tax=unclassified Sporosarcina TaxID=2647733 RepID=UPI000C16EF9C|nr:MULTISPECIES: SDR family NAD(P)-dependent oxidoreductase [unclassified Sporosarcina]PID00841.1 short-chain dehydrogenase [Sporosarcina sp. P29]PID07100.1 short-chain dehydrogenase [Sporosarcina sp. P30]PID10296.1 short-chain dehydrogenase [Sporosarcina sp. P31]PID12194.1 short-chain dehydrogenase [Sporosarcina sp. P32b]